MTLDFSIPQPVSQRLVLADGIFLRGISIPAPGLVPQHSHPWGHLTILAQGRLTAYLGEEILGTFEAPWVFHIPAGAEHKFLTLTPNVLLYCVHNEDRALGGEVHGEPHPLPGDPFPPDSRSAGLVAPADPRFKP